MEWGSRGDSEGDVKAMTANVACPDALALARFMTRRTAIAAGKAAAAPAPAPAPAPDTSATDALEERVSEVEALCRDVAASLTGVSSQVAVLDHIVGAAPNPALSSRVGALDTMMTLHDAEISKMHIVEEQLKVSRHHCRRSPAHPPPPI